MKRKLEKPAGECANKICQRPVYNNGKYCPYHLLDNQQTKLRVSHPSIATTVANALGKMVSIDDHGQRSRLLEETKKKIRMMKRVPKPINQQQQQHTVQEAHSMQQEYKETTTESVLFRQRVSTAESTITRERRPDGTVLEHEVVRSLTNEHEVQFKREVQKSVSLYLKRVATEQHQWTQQIRDQQYWERLSKSVQVRCADDWGIGSLFLHTDLPLDQSLQQHDSQLQTITAAICAAKPTELTLRAKIEWLAFAYKQLKAYPATALAIKHCCTIFSGVERIKKMDAADMATFTQQPAPPKVWFELCCSTNNPSVLSRKKMHWVQAPKAAPLPRTTLTETQLMDFTTALSLYCQYEDTHLALKDKKELHIAAKFVDELMSGEYSRLLCFIASWQISWRVVHNIAMTDLTVIRVDSQTGLRNEYIEMQCNGVRVPFVNEEHNVFLGWARLSVALPFSNFEVILPDFVALRLVGAQVEQWHKDIYCPAIAAHIAVQPRYKEQDFICLDGEQYPRSVLDNAPEFATVLEQLAKKDIVADQGNKGHHGNHERSVREPLLAANCYMNAS